MGQTVNNSMKPTAAILENIRQASKANKDVSQEQLTVTDALDTMVKWFCIH